MLCGLVDLYNVLCQMKIPQMVVRDGYREDLWKVSVLNWDLKSVN